MKNNYLVGIDIGTKKICTLIGQIKSEEEKEDLEIIGYGITESRGLKKGAIVALGFPQSPDFGRGELQWLVTAKILGL